MACVTRLTNSSISYFLSKGWKVDKFEVSIKTKGGILHVSFKPNHESDFTIFTEVWLSGPSVQVFKGEVLYDYSNFSEY